MTMKTAIPAAGEAVPTCSDLEIPIYDVVRFSSILADLLNDALEKDASEYTNRPNTYHLTRDQVDNILWLSMQAEAEALRVSKLWLEVMG